MPAAPRRSTSTSATDQPFPVFPQFTFADRNYQPGQNLTELWNQAPYGPAFPLTTVLANGVVQLGSSASRLGDELLLQPSIVADQGTPARIVSTAFDHQRISLFAVRALSRRLRRRASTSTAISDRLGCSTAHHAMSGRVVIARRGIPAARR